MPEELYDYCGHAIKIVLIEDDEGEWTAAYSIDGDTTHEMRTKPKKSRGLMLAEARTAAQRHADALKR
ncbi:hypothetical protein [Janthinobacterium fluminis]|uniref:Uncharacterized protein n=1 Tax=Janthinobacterium fluminis TaxID=2987524 RepID=A0ABT5JXE2_9BURK|nr:hypothetical protein [Janthinobacterium fluminis]MDC8756820.1 hypothetical protein [Janthinobacterium fluminis]